MAPERFGADPESLAAYKAGQNDQLLANHTEHLREINGSIAESATALTALGKAVVAIDTKIKVAGYIAGTFLTAWASAIVYLIIHVH